MNIVSVDTQERSPTAAPEPAIDAIPRARRGTERSRIALLLGLPAQIISATVLVLPLLLAFYMSFTNWTPTRGSLAAAEFIGFMNYEDLLIYEPRFLEAVARTLGLAVVCLSLEFTIGLGLAVLFQRSFRGKRIAFSILLTPMMILPVVVGYTFWMLFQSNGPINQLAALIGLAPNGIDWLRDARCALAAVIITEVWHWTPLFFLILFSGLSSVPENPIRAAVVLGATNRQVFWRVIFPSILPVVVVAFVIRGMEVIKLFDEVFMLTRGGPGTTTETISLYIYKLAFNDFQLAYAAAAAFIVLVGTLILINLMLTPVTREILARKS